jgi:hypothetical protein
MSNVLEPWIYHGVCTSRNDGHFDVGLWYKKKNRVGVFD